MNQKLIKVLKLDNNSNNFNILYTYILLYESFINIIIRAQILKHNKRLIKHTIVVKKTKKRHIYYLKKQRNKAQL